MGACFTRETRQYKSYIRLMVADNFNKITPHCNIDRIIDLYNDKFVKKYSLKRGCITGEFLNDVLLTRSAYDYQSPHMSPVHPAIYALDHKKEIALRKAREVERACLIKYDMKLDRLLEQMRHKEKF